MRNTSTSDRTRVIVEIALTIALAAALGAIRVWRMPQGGTVSLGMLPLFVLALRRGPVAGVVAGALYGVADFVLDPFPPVHWIQPLLDYPVAYAMCGLAGAFAPIWRRIADTGAVSRAVALAVVPGVLLGALTRYAVHVLSGVVYFGEYAPPGQPVVLYSLVYNSYVLISATLAIAAAAVLMPALDRQSPGGDLR